MGFLADFMPFYPKPGKGLRRAISKDAVERALTVELHANPDLEMRRADNGEMVLRVTRQLHAAERVLGRLLGSTPYRQLVVDTYGEFLITEGCKPGVLLSDVAARMADTFDIGLDAAKMGIVQVVRELMLRDFVFLVRPGQGEIDKD